MWVSTRDRIEQQGLNASLDRPDCVQDGEDGRFRCLAAIRVIDDVREPGQVFRVTIRVTCDEEQCLTEPGQALPGG